MLRVLTGALVATFLIDGAIGAFALRHPDCTARHWSNNCRLLIVPDALFETAEQQ